MSSHRACPLLLCLVLGACEASREPAILAGQSPQMFRTTVTQQVQMQYLLYAPAEYGRDDRAWPLMLFLHGAGERGDDLDLVKVHGPPKLVESDPDFPFLLVSPQCAKNNWWTDEAMQQALVALLDDVCSRYAVDEDRVYVTGLSMGGFGTWSLAARQPERFAAIVPVCGGGEPQAAQTIAPVPAWIFHGGKDDVVPVERSREMAEAMRAAGADVRLTIYPDAGHDSWTESYNNPELYDWMLSHSRRERR